LSMPLEERRQRHAANFKALVANDLTKWGERFLASLEHSDYVAGEQLQVRAAAR